LRNNRRMGRLLLLILLAVVALFVWRKLTARAAGMPAAKDERPAEAVVACAHCGLHVPASEALRDGDHVYCCPEHLRRGSR
jgi:uncharacterized protein